MNRILVVEDERHLAEGLRFNLEAEGYAVEIVSDGESALQLLLPDENTPPNSATPQHFDAVVLDVMLPGINGFTVASEMRARNQFVPVLMLTARSRPEDVLSGFEAGADDYLPKPFELAILIARLRGLLRRRQWSQQTSGTPFRTASSNDTPPASSSGEANDLEPDSVTINHRVIDFHQLEVRTPDGNSARLTLMEANLLRYLFRHEGRTRSRKQMLEDVWGLHEETDTRPIDNFVVRLRRYLEDDPTRPRHLVTVRGIGYRFVATPTD